MLCALSATDNFQSWTTRESLYLRVSRPDQQNQVACPFGVPLMGTLSAG